MTVILEDPSRKSLVHFNGIIFPLIRYKITIFLRLIMAISLVILSCKHFYFPSRQRSKKNNLYVSHKNLCLYVNKVRGGGHVKLSPLNPLSSDNYFMVYYNKMVGKNNKAIKLQTERLWYCHKSRFRYLWFHNCFVRRSVPSIVCQR